MIDFEKTNRGIDANAAIEKALSERIPGYTGIRADGGSDGVYQSDLFGYTDTLTRMGSERLYRNQNKSRSECRNDIALEFRIFRGRPQNRETGQHVPIIGAHYVSGWDAWLAPRFAQLDTITFYLPSADVVLHYSRYYVEIMLSKPETWSEITGMLCKGNDVAIVFWHHAVFTRLYMQTVANVTYGAGETGIQFVREPDTDVLHLVKKRRKYENFVYTYITARDIRSNAKVCYRTRRTAENCCNRISCASCTLRTQPGTVY